MLERKTVSQCVSAAYCCGWNDAATDFERFHRLREKTFAEALGKADADITAWTEEMEAE